MLDVVHQNVASHVAYRAALRVLPWIDPDPRDEVDATEEARPYVDDASRVTLDRRIPVVTAGG